MFPHRLYPARYYPQRYFPQSAGGAAPASDRRHGFALRLRHWYLRGFVLLLLGM